MNDSSENALTKAITSNIVELWRYTSQGNKIIVTDTEELFVIDLGFKSFAPQGVWYTNLTHDSVDRKIEEVLSYFSNEGQPCLWMVNPVMKPDNLGERLKAYSFKEMPGTPGMFIELENLVDDRPRPEKLTLEEVIDEDSTRQFFDIYCEGYPMPQEFGQILCEARINHGYKPDVNRQWIGYLDGEPVATSQLFLGGGVAGLYGVTVLPAARGHGVGTEMSLHPLRVALSMGYQFGILDATQQGYSVYKRIGFKELFRPTMYNFDPSGDEGFHERMKDWMLSERN